jgi:AcrR family transcriptional regulator
VVTDSARRLRADAARNAERILRATRDVYAESGPEAPLEEIAQRAGVGIRTLFRRFPNKADLLQAVIEQSLATELDPVVEQALDDADPLRALVTVIEAAMTLASRDRSMLAAARDAGSTVDASIQFYETLARLARRAQQAGLVRADLVPDDLPRIMAMLVSVLWSMPPGSKGWQRYLALVLDSLSPAAERLLPQAPRHARISPAARSRK